MNAIRNLAIAIMLLGLVGLAMGGAFVGLGVSKNNQLTGAMQEEKVTLGIEGAETEGEVIDSLGESQKAGDTIREHRRGIAATYSDLLGGGRYNPEDPRQLTYAQAMNLENYLYLAVVAFGLTQSVTASGAFMIVTGLAIGATGIALYRLNKKLS
jgi:hypothetical protein